MSFAGVLALNLSRRDRNRADRVPVAPPRTSRGEDAEEELGIRTLTRRSKKSVDLALSGRGNNALAREILRFAQDDTEKPRISF